MTVLTLNVRPEPIRVVVDEDYDFVVQILESPSRYIRVHQQGKKITYQKNFIYLVEDDSDDTSSTF